MAARRTRQSSGPSDQPPLAVPDRTLAALIADGIVVHDLAGVIVDVNAAACRSLGYAREELIGRPLTDIDTALTPDTARATLQQLLQDGQVTHQGHHRRKDGSALAVEVHSALCEWAGAPHVLGVVRDVSARRAAERRLQAIEESLRLCVEASNTGLWDWDLRTNTVRYSDSWWTQLGYDPAAPRDAWDTWWELLHPDDRQRVADAVLPILAGGADAYDIELRVRHADGRYRWVVSRAAVQRAPDGTPLRLLGAHVDITRRKEAEEALREHARELETANRDLEAFSYSVSHDLRAPLRAVKGFARILQEDYAGRLPPQGVRLLERVAGGAARMEELIDALLALSQIGRQDLWPRAIDLSALAHAVATEMSARAPARRVAWQIAPHLLAHADPGLARLLLEILFDNAWKYTAPRAVARIELGLAAAGPPPVFCVRDNGVGIDMAYAERLFQPFQRLHTPAEFPGTGIGLATALRIVRRHGGRMRAEAAVDAGATISFTLAPS